MTCRNRCSAESRALFGDARLVEFDNPQFVTYAGLRDRVESTSWVGALPDSEREAFFDRAAALADGLEEPIEVPYHAEVWLFPRLD